MHPWLSHLLEDIAAAHRKESPEPETSKSFDEEMEEIEQWVIGDEPKETFGDYCGLKSESFPPPDQLTEGEMKKVCRALRKMVASWNHGDDFPDQLPVPLTYKFLIETLDKGTFIPSSGFITFDYCSGYAPECVFKEYCTCLQFCKDK